MVAKLSYRHDFQLKDAMNFYENEDFSISRTKILRILQNFLNF